MEKRVHGKTSSRRYVEAIDNAIRRYDNPDELVEFLDSVARDLHDLNKYADSKGLLDSKFDELLTKIEELSE